MQYMLLICTPESSIQALAPADIQKVMEGYMRFNQEASAAGVLLANARLRPTSTATTVRVKDGKTIVTDGPFAETKEQIGGYYLIDVKDLDEALRWAAKIPSARFGGIEVRPVWPQEEYMRK
jgi:hypothetical protein